MKKRSVQTIKNKGVRVTLKARRIRTVRDARSLLGSILYHYQKGNVSSSFMRDMIYGLIKYGELFASSGSERMNPESLT